MRRLAALVLAAGKGTRMRSRLPKVLHPLAGRPLLDHVLTAIEGLASDAEAPEPGKALDGPLPIVAIVSQGAESIRIAFDSRCHFATQKEQLGTADAVLAAQSTLLSLSPVPSHVLILPGDAPLLTTQTLRSLLNIAHQSDSPLALVSAQAPDPTGYGRLVRNEQGRICAIIEEKNASTQQRAITEINTSIYCINTDWLWENLPHVQRNPVSGEYYLVDLVEMAAKQGHTIPTTSALLDEVMGVNDRVQLAQAESIMRYRILERLMLSGVTITDPASTFIDASVQIGQDSVIQPFTTITGRTIIGSDCRIGPQSVISDSKIGDRCVVIGSWLEEATLETNVHAGPMSHLRPGAYLASGVYLGNYAEVKKSFIGAGTKMHHFSFMGDATVGEHVNIGAGTITCNYDGTSIKKQTIIEDGASIGSDTLFIAPVRMGQDATTGAGAVVNRDIPPSTLVVGMPARVIRHVHTKKGKTRATPSAAPAAEQGARLGETGASAPPHASSAPSTLSQSASLNTPEQVEGEE
jgi:bifunctional UDP-N-acetylglucosamine pyrophosphorylase/glucosamine-1-phosphate N-acetyltransferase